MNIKQDFIAKTLVESVEYDVCETILAKSEADAYKMVNGKFAGIYLRKLALLVNAFHELGLNNQECSEAVDMAVLKLHELIEDVSEQAMYRGL